MLQSFVWFPEFAKFSESSVLFWENLPLQQLDEFSGNTSACAHVWHQEEEWCKIKKYSLNCLTKVTIFDVASFVQYEKKIGTKTKTDIQWKSTWKCEATLQWKIRGRKRRPPPPHQDFFIFMQVSGKMVK